MEHRPYRTLPGLRYLGWGAGTTAPKLEFNISVAWWYKFAFTLLAPVGFRGKRSIGNVDKKKWQTPKQMPGTVYIILPGPFQRKTRYSTSETDTMRTMRFVEIHAPVYDVSDINNQMHLYLVNLSEFGFRICHLPTGCILFDCCCRVIRVFAIKNIAKNLPPGISRARFTPACIWLSLR